MFTNKSFLKPHYRTEMSIIIEILDATMDGRTHGMIYSAVYRRTNLSHFEMKEKCQKLMDAGLIETVMRKRNIIIKITEKGMRFFQELQSFLDLIKKMNLRF